MLFRTDLKPEYSAESGNDTFYGIKINTSDLNSSSKTLELYQYDKNERLASIKSIEDALNAFQQNINQEKMLLADKYGKQLSELKEDIKVLSYSLELAEQKEQKLNAELEEWKNRARQETEQSLSGNRQRFNLLEEELQLLTRKKNILLQDYNKQLDKLQENSKSRIDEIKKRQDAEMAEMDSEKKNRVKEFEQKETELNTEKEKNFKSKGVDSKLLKQVEQQIEKLQIEMRALEQFDSLINDYLKDKRELFDALPELNEKKEQFVKYNSDLQEAIEEAKRKTNLEEMELNKQKRTYDEELIEFNNGINFYTSNFRESPVYHKFEIGRAHV